MNPQINPRLEEKHTAFWPRILALSLLPEWLRNPLRLLTRLMKALAGGVFFAFLGYCAAMSVYKFSGHLVDFTAFGDWLRGGYPEVLLVLYAAWHVYHDGHGFICCPPIINFRGRLQGFILPELTIQQWKSRIAPYRYV